MSAQATFYIRSHVALTDFLDGMINLPTKHLKNISRQHLTRSLSDRNDVSKPRVCKGEERVDKNV